MQGPDSQLGMNSNVTSDKHFFAEEQDVFIAVKWASEEQQACAKSCNILTLLNTLVSRKSRVVWSLGHFKHKGKKCIEEKDSHGLVLEERPR